MSAPQDLKSWAGIRRDGEGITLAVVFTDIIDSTKLAHDLGNQAMFKLLRDHFERARANCDWHEGFEIKRIGDGYMAAFRTVADALQFALDFRKDTGSSAISIRVGIDQGQVRIWENDIYGLMANYAARLLHCDLSEQEGIYISAAAQRSITQEYGSRPLEFFVGPVVKVRPMKGFSSEPVYQVVCPDMTLTRAARRKAAEVDDSLPSRSTPPAEKSPDPALPTRRDLGITPRPTLDLPTRKQPDKK